VRDIRVVYPSFEHRDAAFLNGRSDIAFYCDPVGSHPDDSYGEGDIEAADWGDVKLQPGSQSQFLIMSIHTRVMIYFLQAQFTLLLSITTFP
jgi:hypothetical protein